MSRFICSLIIWLTVQGVSAQEWRDMGCLTPEQQEHLMNLNRKLVADAQTLKHFAELRSIRSQMASLKPDVDEACNKPFSGLNLFDAIGADADGCKARISQYNHLNGNAGYLTKRIDDDQRVILIQLNMERSLLPACR